MSRPIVASAHSVKRSASVPCAGMPFGNCLRVFFSMRSRRCGCIRPLVRLATSDSRSMPSIDVERVDDVALGLRHLVAVLVADQPGDVDVAERHVAGELQAHHHHARDPEEDDVEARDQHAGRIERLQLRRLLRPAERRERPQRGGEPRVEHVLVARQLRVAAELGARLRLRLLPASARRRCCRSRRTTPESDGPTTAGG